MHKLSWLVACRTLAGQNDLSSQYVRALDAFGISETSSPAPTPPLPPEAVEAAFREHEEATDRIFSSLQARVIRGVAREVDSEQARMFARRLKAVEKLLADLCTTAPEARILRVGLAHRIDEILATECRTALRVRAAVDFYYSQASMLRFQQVGTAPATTRPTLRELTLKMKWRRVERGLLHGRIAGITRNGPVHINVLKADRARVRFRSLDCRSTTLDFPDFVQSQGALAGISGGYFLYSEQDISPPSARFDPVGLLVSDGELLNPPLFYRSTFIQDREGHVHIKRLGLKGVSVKAPGGLLVRIAAVNSPAAIDQRPVAFTRAWGETVPPAKGPGLTFVGRQCVLSTRAIPLNGACLLFPPGPEWDELVAGLAQTEGPLAFSLPKVPGIAGIRDAMAGGPLLLDQGAVNARLEQEEFVGSAPPATFSSDETHDMNLLPRMAVGITQDHEVVAVAVDGRNVEAALGLTLGQTARLMKWLGCHTAMNLDGGSSKRMVVDGRSVDLATTEIVDGRRGKPPVRPVHSCLLVFSAWSAVRR